MSFGEQLTKLRKRNNLTQIELADTIGVKHYVISAWENDRTEPNISQLSKLGDLFGVSIDYLIDKEVIIAMNEEQFIKTIENINKDVNDEFIKTIHSLCDDFPENKKEKMLNVIKASTELIK